MREIRTSGSEGGETGRTGLPYPYRIRWGNAKASIPRLDRFPAQLIGCFGLRTTDQASGVERRATAL